MIFLERLKQLKSNDGGHIEEKLKFFNIIKLPFTSSLKQALVHKKATRLKVFIIHKQPAVFFDLPVYN